jgi:tetratricopeptide (TPR) repeat protein
LGLWLPPPLAADALAELPGPWVDQLRAVPEADISGAERVGREAIAETRRRLAEHLSSETADKADLAQGFGQLAALYQRFGIDSASALCWDNARMLQPQEFRWTYYAAYLALTRGHTERALKLFQQARALESDYPALDLRLGQLWLDTNRLVEARAALEKASTRPGLRAAALYYLGQIDLLERDYPTAQRHLTQALAINPAASEVHYPLAQAYRHLGKSDQAREHLAQFKASTPEVEDPLVSALDDVLDTSRDDFSRAMQAVFDQDYATAVEHFRSGLEIDPGNLDARVSYARALYLSGEQEAAEKQLRTVLREDSSHTLANFLLAVLHHARDEPEPALEHYGRVLEQDPDHEGARFYQAGLLFQQGRFREAAEAYGKALEINPDIPPARLHELVTWHHAGRGDTEIAAALEERLAAHPDQTELKYALIRLRALSLDPQVRDSVRALNLANELAPAQPTPAHIQALALAAAADGQFDEAARLQQQVLDMVRWMGTAEQIAKLEEGLEAFKAGRMAEEPIWPASDPLLAPPPLNPFPPFRDYPAAVPY